MIVTSIHTHLAYELSHCTNVDVVMGHTNHLFTRYQYQFYMNDNLSPILLKINKKFGVVWLFYYNERITPYIKSHSLCDSLKAKIVATCYDLSLINCSNIFWTLRNAAKHFTRHLKKNYCTIWWWNFWSQIHFSKNSVSLSLRLLNEKMQQKCVYNTLEWGM